MTSTISPSSLPFDQLSLYKNQSYCFQEKVSPSTIQRFPQKHPDTKGLIFSTPQKHLRGKDLLPLHQLKNLKYLDLSGCFSFLSSLDEIDTFTAGKTSTLFLRTILRQSLWAPFILTLQNSFVQACINFQKSFEKSLPNEYEAFRIALCTLRMFIQPSLQQASAEHRKLYKNTLLNKTVLILITAHPDKATYGGDRW